MISNSILFWLIIIAMVIAALNIVLFPNLMQKISSKIQVLVLVVISIALPVGGMGLYWHLGAWNDLERHWQNKKNLALSQQELKKMHNPWQVVAKLKRYLQQNPQQAKGWYLLGKLYLDHQQYQRASEAFGKALQADPKLPLYQTAYAEALFFANHNRLNSIASKILVQVLKYHPKNVDAVNLLAIDAFNAKQYRRAIVLWEKLIERFPPQSADAKVLYAMIAKAQMRLRLNNK